jgi:hypothetical protein
MGQKEIPPMKKEATPKRKGLKRKTFDKKKRQPQNARGLKERPPMKKRTPKRKGFKRGPTMKKEAISQTKNQEPLVH